jgi:hypothetical protein
LLPHRTPAKMKSPLRHYSAACWHYCCRERLMIAEEEISSSAFLLFEANRVGAISLSSWAPHRTHLKNVDQGSGQVLDPELAVGSVGRRKSGAYT